MIFKKLIIFSLLLCVAPAVAMKTLGGDLPGNPAKRVKVADTRSLYQIYQAGDFMGFIQSLVNGANPNEVAPDGNAIILITQLEDKFTDEEKRRAFKALKKYGADVNAQTDGMGLSLVHIAAERGEPEWVAFYLNGGVDPNLLDNDDHTALWYTGDEEIMGMLFRAGLDAAATEGINQRTALFGIATIRPRHTRMAEEMVVRNPHIVGMKDEKAVPYKANETPYEYAARKRVDFTTANPHKRNPYMPANPELENEETSRKIVERRVFPQMTETIHPGFVGGTVGFVRGRETGARKFNIKQLREPAPIASSSSSSSASSSGSSDESSSYSD